MNKIIDQINKEQIAALGKNIPEFSAGDTLRVHVKVSEGGRDRIQVYEGVCIARSNDGLNSSFSVRKLSFGEGVERVFPLYSPVVDKIEVVRRGDVRRAKLYYLRGRTGKSARITEKTDNKPANSEVVTPMSPAEETVDMVPATETAPAKKEATA